MEALAFNLFSEFTETIGYKPKREVIKKSNSSQTIRIRGFYKKNINMRKKHGNKRFHDLHEAV
jgi:hypothetical protein